MYRFVISFFIYLKLFRNSISQNISNFTNIVKLPYLFVCVMLPLTLIILRFDMFGILVYRDIYLNIFVYFYKFPYSFKYTVRYLLRINETLTDEKSQDII